MTSSIQGVSPALIEDVRREVMASDRTYISVKHIDLDAQNSEIGRALSYLEGEGLLEKYNERRSRSLYTRAEGST